MSDISIRYAQKKDAAPLAELGEQTFREAYYTDSHLEQKYIDRYIAKTFNPSEVGADLAGANTIFLLAEFEDKPIGYARLLPESTRPEIVARKPFEISRIYLTKDFWGRRFGALLLERCIAEAEKHLCDVVWLSVWQYNERAIAFYKKHGFRQIGKHIFDLASSPQTDFIMVKSLKVKR